MKKVLITVIGLCLVFFLASAALAALQTQPSTDGNFEVSLIKARVRGEVLTVQVMFKNISSEFRVYEFPFGDVYYADIQNHKKYYGLKDTQNMYIAGPSAGTSYGGYIRSELKPGKQCIFWIKFPAPATDTDKIDIFIPFALPFEEVSLQR